MPQILYFIRNCNLNIFSEYRFTLNKAKNYSGEFYSNGKAQMLKNVSELDSVLSLNKKLFFVIPTKKEQEIPQKYLDQMKLIDHNYKTSVFETK